MRRREKGLGLHDAGRERAKAFLLRCAVEAVADLLRPVRLNLRRVFEEAVLQFLRPRRLPRIPDELRARDNDTVFQFQIPGHQVREEDASAPAVRQRVEELHRDPVAVVQNPQAVALQFRTGHESQRVGIVFPDQHR